MGGKRPILVDVVLGTLFFQYTWSQSALRKMAAGYLQSTRLPVARS